MNASVDTIGSGAVAHDARPRVYDRAILLSMRRAIMAGVIGGGLLGVIGQLTAEPILTRLVLSPFVAADLFKALAVELAIALIGLILTIGVLGLTSKFPSRQVQVWSGAGTGLIFTLVLNWLLLGPITGVLFAYPAFPLVGGGVPNETVTRFLIEGDYSVISGYYGFTAGLVMVMVLAGAIFGRLLLPYDRAERIADDTRDTLGSFAILLLPFFFDLLAIFNLAAFALLDQKLQQNLISYGDSYPVSVVVYGVVPPLIFQLLVQMVGIGWVWRIQPDQVHRSLLRFTQVLYGISGIGIPIFITGLINPSFAGSPPGIIWISITVLLALIFVVMAQRKLDGKPEGYTIVTIGTWGLMGAAWRTMLIGWLCADMLTLRPYNDLLFLVGLSFPQLESLTNAFNQLIHLSVAASGEQFLAVFVITLVPLVLISWAIARSERRAAHRQRFG